jgi:hypothetical protein
MKRHVKSYSRKEKIRPETRSSEDYSAFKCSAWCFNPVDIPRSLDLFVVEPALLVEEQPPSKHALRYPIVVGSSQPSSSETVHPDNNGNDNTGHRRLLGGHEFPPPVNEARHLSSAGQSAPTAFPRGSGGTAAPGQCGVVAVNEALPEEIGNVGSAVSGVGDEIVAAVEAASPSPIETTPESLGIDGMGSAVSGVGDEIVAAVEAASPSPMEPTAELLGIDDSSVRIPATVPEASSPSPNPAEGHAQSSIGGPPAQEDVLAAGADEVFPLVDSPTLVAFEVPPTTGAIEEPEPGCMAGASPCRHAPPCLQPTSPLAWLPASTARTSGRPQRRAPFD